MKKPKQQTAIQKIIEQFKMMPTEKDFCLWFRNNEEILADKEKQQIVNTFKDAQVLHAMGKDLRAEQYFDNTFNK